MTSIFSLFTNKVFLDQVHNILIGIFGAATAAGVSSSNTVLTVVSALALTLTTISSSVNAVKPNATQTTTTGS